MQAISNVNCILQAVIEKNMKQNEVKAQDLLSDEIAALTSLQIKIESILED